MKNFEPIRMTAEREREYIMEAIMYSYYNMDEYDWAHWSVETAKLLIEDFERYDHQIGLAPIHYDPQDIYETMLELRKSEEEYE